VRRALYVVVILLVANLGALTDLVLHPEIPYADLEHLLTGGLSALAVAFALGAFEMRFRNRQRETLWLQESEYLFRESQRAARLGSYRTDLIANEWKSSEVLDDLFGIDASYPRDVEGWLALVHPDERDAMARYRQQEVVGDRQTFDREYRVVRKSDGAVRWVHELAATTLDASGAPITMIGTIQDITERRRAELEREVMHEIASGVVTSANLDELLALMHRSLQRVLDANNCFVALHDAKTGRFSFPYFVDQFDVAPEPAALSDTCTAYVFRRGEPALITLADFSELQESGEVALVGAQSPSWMGVPLRTPSGMIGVLVVQHYEREDVYDEADLRFLASVGDHAALVIERKLAEAALRDSERELNVILNATADGLLAVGVGGNVLRTNKRFAEMWGIPQALLDSRDDDKLLRHVLGQLADPEEFLAKVKALYDSTEEANDIVRFPDGRVFERYTAPILEGGNPVGRIWSFRDVSTRERAVAAKAALEDRLRHAERLESVGRLAGGIAHDFNNMLAVILGLADLAVLKVDRADPLHADLAEIRKAASRSADLTRQLLAYARRETIMPQVLDLNDAVEHLLSMLKRLIGEDITVKWEPGSALWPVSMDPSQLGNILTNLCVNARHAIADVGTIALATANCTIDEAFCAEHADAAPGEYVRLTISDTGCGMDEATLKLVFEPFFTTKGVGEGTGLGLSSVYGAVRQNDGFLTVRSVVNTGTTFDIYLPRQPEELKKQRTSGPRTTISARGQETILVVEDEPSILQLVRRLLEAHGYSVLTASTPDDAMRLAADHSGDIDLLLTDVIMPEMNGRDLAERVRALRPQLKLLFMSGHPADVVASRGLLDPGVSLVEKPFSTDALLRHVRNALDGA
jgi:PAS domain S-box-containing protein